MEAVLGALSVLRGYGSQGYPGYGVRPSDLDKYRLPPQCRLQLTDHDRRMGEELLKEEFVQRHPAWVKELEIMLKKGEKAEIQALSSFGFQYITEQFLPRKLLEGDWI